ncbi:MAG: hypothetical protein H7249_08175 [Chitinophagaceae bacterium]|nr:hypothetical protein [Oligoflexus sp.]
MKILFCLVMMNLALVSSAAWAKDAEPQYHTTIDFDSTMIDGKMKAPSGFFLQGRNKQSLTNLVKLRANFKPQLKDSKAAVKSLVK